MNAKGFVIGLIFRIVSILLTIIVLYAIFNFSQAITQDLIGSGETVALEDHYEAFTGFNEENSTELHHLNFPSNSAIIIMNPNSNFALKQNYEDLTRGGFTGSDLNQNHPAKIRDCDDPSTCVLEEYTSGIIFERPSACEDDLACLCLCEDLTFKGRNNRMIDCEELQCSSSNEFLVPERSYMDDVFDTTDLEDDASEYFLDPLFEYTYWDDSIILINYENILRPNDSPEEVEDYFGLVEDQNTLIFSSQYAGYRYPYVLHEMYDLTIVNRDEDEQGVLGVCFKEDESDCL